MCDLRTAETIAKYHDEHAGYGGASFEFHARSATWIRDVALECQRLAAELATMTELHDHDHELVGTLNETEIRLAARVAGLEAVLRSIEWGGKCGELFVVEICPACGGSVEHEQGCALNAAKGAEHE